MKTVLTAKLKLHTTPEQFQALRQTQLAYRDALNAVSRYAFEQGKSALPTAIASLAKSAHSVSVLPFHKASGWAICAAAAISAFQRRGSSIC